MKQYRLNFNTIKIYLIVLAFLFLGAYIFSSVKKVRLSAEETDTTSDIMVGGTGEYSVGYNHGNIYSIDGQPISEDMKVIVDGEEQTRHCGIPEFTPVLGIEGFIGNGLINKCEVTLHSSASKPNIEARTGNSIQTTFSYNGQCVASSLLKENFPLSVCDGASVAVVLKDGTVLVGAGSNGYEAGEFDLNDEKNFPKDICNDKTASNYAVGSVAKVLTAVTLLLNDKYIGSEYSLYNEHFIDVSSFSHGGHIINNHDCYNAGAYELLNSEGIMTRYTGLCEALVNSSNTYFWRHALNFGLEKTFNAMDEIFEISKPRRTEINTLSPVEVEKERLDYFFWGQDFSASPVTLCSMYNFAVSGEKFSPFYITSVYTPDNKEVFRKKPEIEKTFSDEKMKKILTDSLAECFRSYCNYIDPYVYEPYSELIKDNRILAKSGTADVIENELTNHTRVMTILDENHDVVCTACIAVNRATNKCTVNDNILFNILFTTLEASGIL